MSGAMNPAGGDCRAASATSLSCASTKPQQTSPTAADPAAAVAVKSNSPTSTKKAWRQRLEMDAAAAALGGVDPNQSTTSFDGGGGVADAKEVVPGLASLQPAQFFPCHQCGKCFITLKYLEMHTALHGEHQTAPVSAVTVKNTQTSLLPPRSTGPPQSAPQHPVTASAPVAVDAGKTGKHGSGEGGEVAEGGVSRPAFHPTPPSRDRDWTCDICHKTFSQNSSYKNHQRTHSDERPFVCSICSIGFKERYHLKKHVLFKHSTEAREECRVCGKRFKDSTAVRAHERIHSDERPYSCGRCQKAFKTSECLWHHENRSKSCGAAMAAADAPTTTASRRGRKRFTREQQPTARPPPPQSTMPKQLPHLPRGVLDPATFASLLPFVTNCTLANAITFPLQNIQLTPHGALPGLAVELAGLRKIETAASPVTSVQTQQAVPPTLQISTPAPQYLNVDRTAVKPEVDSSPEVRLDEVSLDAAAGLHREGLVLLANCAVSQPSPDIPRTTQVKVEPEVVLSDYELTAMTSLESGGFYERIRLATEAATRLPVAAEVTCSGPEALPGDEFGTKNGGPEVVDRRLECQHCGRLFSSVAAFDKHAIVHSELRPYRCERCDVGFKLKVHLKKHNLYRHSDQFQCACRHCGKRFKDSSAVRLHERIHSNDRPFGCQTCGKTFKTRENLWGHRHRGPCGQALQTAAATSAVEHGDAGEMTSDSQQPPNVDELAVDNEVLVHDCDVLDRQSVAVVEPHAEPMKDVVLQQQQALAKALLWSGDRQSVEVVEAARTPGQPLTDAVFQQQQALAKALLWSGDRQSVAVVEAGRALDSATLQQQQAAAKALLWAYNRAAFSANPAVVPTAVVAPFNREISEVPGSGTATPPIYPVQTAPAHHHEENAQQPEPQAAAAPPLTKAHLPPFETFRAHAISSGNPSTAAQEISTPVCSGSTHADAVNLSVSTRACPPGGQVTADPTQIDAIAVRLEPLPVTTSAVFPLPVWHLPSAAVSVVDTTAGSYPANSASSKLYAAVDHVALSVQQATPLSADCSNSQDSTRVSPAGGATNNENTLKRT